MKISCCCFTCIIGEDKDGDKEENDRLLGRDNSDDRSTLTQKGSYSRSASALSSSSTNRGLSTESGDPFSESLDGAPVSKDKFNKAVNVLKRYNVMSSKYKTKELERQMSMPARLRIRVALKFMSTSNIVKVSVVEALDVMSAVRNKWTPESTVSSDQDEPSVIQVRTKILHSEVRGHTKKYEIRGSLPGALKFKNETIHSVNFEEFVQSKIRFRLYFVMKHARDKLLGEYTLDVATLEYDKSVTTQYVTLDLYDSTVAEFDALSATSPGLTNRFAGFDSQTSTENETRGASTPKIQRQAKIRSQDSETKRSTEKADDSGDKSGDESSIRKALRSLRSGTSRDQSIDSLEAAANANEFDRLKMAAKERSEKIGELDESTAAMADSASNLNLLSVKLKEKYKAKVGKSKSSDT